MEVKSKISDLAKSFGVSSKEIIEILRTHADSTKKYSTATTIDGAEMSIVLACLTQAHSVASFDDYFAQAKPIEKAEQPAQETAAQKPAAAKSEAKPEEKKPARKKPRAEEAQGEKPRRAARPESKGEAKPEEKKPAPVQGAAKKESAAPAQPKKEAAAPQPTESAAKPAEKSAEQPAQPVVRKPAAAQGATVLGTIQIKPRQPKQQPKQQPKPRNEQKGNAQQGGQKQGRRGDNAPQQAQSHQPQQSQTQTAAAASQTPAQSAAKPGQNLARVPKNTATKGPRAPQKPKGPAQARNEQSIERTRQEVSSEVRIVDQSAVSQSDSKKRVVDTRSSHVTLEKYDTRFDDMAHSKGGRRMENTQQKQKLTQRSQQYRRQQKGGKRETERERLARIEAERQKKQLVITCPPEITVSELAARLKATAAEVVKKLFLMGVMVTVNETIDFDTAYLVAEEFHCKVEPEVIVTIEERIIDDSEDEEGNLVPRSPVVVVMGHVDHGKTSLLDRIRQTSVTATEAGGITQHIGAYRVRINDQEITFLDTPGHEAFTTMRARGAQVTDIAVLVVAADDGIMPQTVEAINHAKAAGVSIIVAINKMDKPAADPDRVKTQLTEYSLVPEEWGGDVICVPVSAKSGMGIEDLLENIVLVADMKELRANPDRAGKGTVIEARLDKGRGPIATVLVQNGTLHAGDIIVAGTSVGRVRAMTNDRGERVETAGPSFPVEITGLDSVPTGGDTFNCVSDERLARELVEQRRNDQKEAVFQQQTRVTLENLFSQMQEGDMKELKIIIKADVQGSVEAVRQSLEKLSNEEVRVNVIHGAVGAVNESDVSLADASNAIIVGFNVRPDAMAAEHAEQKGVDMRLYRIIYDCIEEIEQAMKGMLAPKTRVVDLGRAEVRQSFRVSGVGVIAGCHVVSGKIMRNALIRVVRDGIVIAEDKISSLRRFKDDVKEVAQGYECGIGLEKFGDIKEGDFLEAFIIEEYRD